MDFYTMVLRKSGSDWVALCLEQKRVVPIDMGAKELSPPYVLRIFRQFGFTDDEIERLLK
jgi:hypothetical protein